jgi:hypothetical protein
MTVTLSEYVAILEQLIGQGEYHLQRQREVVVELERDGQDTRHARDVLRALERSRSVHLSELEWLRQEITTALAHSLPQQRDLSAPTSSQATPAEAERAHTATRCTVASGHAGRRAN